MSRSEKLIRILRYTDSPPRERYRGKSGNLADAFENVGFGAGLLRKHLTHNLTHPCFFREIHFKNKLLLGMGDDQTF